MKRMTLGQRLNTTVALLVLLLLVVFGLFVWTREERGRAAERNHQLSEIKSRIQSDMVTLSDSIKGLLLNPKDDVETNHWRVAQSDLGATIDAVQAERDRGGFSDYPLLVNAVKSLRDFTVKYLVPFQATVMKLVDKDPAAAIAECQKSYPEVRDRREKVLADLNQQIEYVGFEEYHRAHIVALVGFVLIGVVLLLTLYVG